LVDSRSSSTVRRGSHLDVRRPKSPRPGRDFDGGGSILQHPGPMVNAPVKSFDVMVQRTRLGVLTRQGTTDIWDVSKTFKLVFRLEIASFTFWISYEPTGLRFCVTGDGNLLSLTPISFPLHRNSFEFQLVAIVCRKGQG